MTQNKLANKCKFGKATMSRIEAGECNPTIRTLYKISKSLDVPIFDDTYKLVVFFKPREA